MDRLLLYIPFLRDWIIPALDRSMLICMTSAEHSMCPSRMTRQWMLFTYTTPEYLAKTEGIIPAIESAHAVAYARKLAPTMKKDQIIVINISGRGDKDCAAIARYRGEDIHE